MVITYTNQHGTIRMNGGGHDKAWRIYDIAGIGFPVRNFTYNTFAGINGQELNTVSIPSRTITISGDISQKARDALSLSRVMRILNSDGELAIITGRKRRRATVRTLSFELDERKSMYKKFVLQLESDNPYFFGHTPLTRNVYRRENILTSQFILPCVFSTRTTAAGITNNGDVASEPIIKISKNAPTQTRSIEPIIITNETTGTSITVYHTMQEGETVEINIPKRTITSDISGNLLNEISDDTVLSAFKLEPGYNYISCKTTDTSLAITCTFDELHLEASHDE